MLFSLSEVAFLVKIFKLGRLMRRLQMTAEVPVGAEKALRSFLLICNFRIWLERRLHNFALFFSNYILNHHFRRLFQKYRIISKYSLMPIFMFEILSGVENPHSTHLFRFGNLHCQIEFEYLARSAASTLRSAQPGLKGNRLRNRI